MKKTNFLFCVIVTSLLFSSNLFAFDIPIGKEWENPFVLQDGSNFQYFYSLASKPKYSFSYDQEIPIVLWNRSNLSGFMNHSAYISFNTWNENGFSSLDIGYNVAAFELSPSFTYTSFLSTIGGGYIPFLPEFGYFLTCYHQEKNTALLMGSLFIGFSYTERQRDYPYYIIFSVNAGPIYTPKIVNEEKYVDDFINYEKFLRSYDSMKNISGKWGARINVKAKFYSSDLAEHGWNVGLGVGLTQYIFKNNFFNSFDIGPVFIKMF